MSRWRFRRFRNLELAGDSPILPLFCILGTGPGPEFHINRYFVSDSFRSGRLIYTLEKQINCVADVGGHVRECECACVCVCTCVCTVRRWSGEARTSESHGIYRERSSSVWLTRVPVTKKRSLATPSIKLGFVEKVYQSQSVRVGVRVLVDFGPWLEAPQQAVWRVLLDLFLNFHSPLGKKALAFLGGP